MTTSAIPIPIQTLLDLFATSLGDVRFADLDAQTLARLAAGVEEAATEVAAAQSALDAAREVLQETQDALLQQSHRALAYARVYAENDTTLSAQLDAVTLPRGARSRAPRAEDALVLSSDVQPPPSRPRGRPRKARPVEPILDPIFPSPAE